MTLGKKLAAILNPATKRSIAEAELQALVDMRATIEARRRELKAAEAELEQLENGILVRLKASARIYGKLTAVVDIVKGASRPHYKDELCEHMLKVHGQDPAVTEAEAQARWPGRPCERVVVSPKQLLTGVK